MQLTIKNTHIFDRGIQNDFKKFIELKKDKFHNNKSYMLTIIYNASSVLDRDDFDFCNSIYNIKREFTHKNKKSEALGIQLDECKNILKDYGIECYKSSIEGHNLKNNNIKITLEEDKSEPSYTGRGKNRKRDSLTTIISNMDDIMSRMSKVYNDQMNKIYSNFREFISINYMCKILDIQYTEDENIIYKKFCKEYDDLWFCSEERERELKDKMLNRVKVLMDMEKKEQKISDRN